MITNEEKAELAKFSYYKNYNNEHIDIMINIYSYIFMNKTFYNLSRHICYVKSICAF